MLQHVPFEGLGSIEPWLADGGYTTTWTRFFAGDELPAVHDVDFVIALGGPMSVNDEARFPWLRAEKRFVREAVESGRFVLGICLGAQLIASAMGGRVYPNREREIGWFPVHGVLERAPEPAARGSSVQGRAHSFPESFDAFHWHGETFDLPPEATLLARNDACENQAFALGATVVGLQFHLETTPESARGLIDNCRDEMVGGRYVQSEASILATPEERYDSVNALMANLLRGMSAGL